MATRPRAATLRANVRPAMPLPRTRKSNRFIQLESRVIDQPRFPDVNRQGHLDPFFGLVNRLEGRWIKELDVIHPGRGRMLDEAPQLFFEADRLNPAFGSDGGSRFFDRL